MVNTTILRRLEVATGRVNEVLYTYIGVFVAYTGGWIEVLTRVHDHTPPEQGPVQYRVTIKDIEHAMVYHFHALRTKRIRLYKATIRDDGDIAIDERDHSLHNPANSVNSRPKPLRRGFVVPCSWYIVAKVDPLP